MTEMTRTHRTRALRAAWTAAHEPVPGVPRWAARAALAVPLVVLPSSLWRIAACTFHAPITRGVSDPSTTASNIPGLPIEVYVVLLSIVSEFFAFTAFGMVARWGEVVPRWLPGLGGRRVPRLAAALPAAIGASILTVLWTWLAITMSLGLRIDGSRATATTPFGFGDWKGLLTYAAYLPLAAWGPLLAALTVAYWRRRGTGRIPQAEGLGSVAG